MEDTINKYHKREMLLIQIKSFENKTELKDWSIVQVFQKNLSLKLILKKEILCNKVLEI